MMAWSIAQLAVLNRVDVTRTLSFIRFYAKVTNINLPTLTMYTKEDCTLCDDAKYVLQPHWNRFTFEEVDITKHENKKWFNKYRFDIPVFHLNGKFLMKHKVNKQLLTRKLQELIEE